MMIAAAPGMTSALESLAAIAAPVAATLTAPAPSLEGLLRLCLHLRLSLEIAPPGKAPIHAVGAIVGEAAAIGTLAEAAVISTLAEAAAGKSSAAATPSG